MKRKVSKNGFTLVELIVLVVLLVGGIILLRMFFGGAHESLNDAGSVKVHANRMK